VEIVRIGKRLPAPFQPNIDLRHGLLEYLERVFFTYRPAPPLASSVEMFWYGEGYNAAHRTERALPNGRFQLIIDLSDGFARDEEAAAQRHQPATVPLVVGLQSRFAVLETAALQHIISVVFRPGGTRALFDVPADAFYNTVVSLEQVWGADADSLRDRLRDTRGAAAKFCVLETALLRHRRERLELHGAVRYALRRFQSVPHIRSVLDVNKETGLSRRRFAQLFREQVGTTPKLYCRIRRFQRIVQRIACGAPVDWAEVALAGGYCDQAHLANEFREFSGITPGVYLASDRPSVNHVPIE
jgi:AraC-like DNA-binding protein